MLRKPPDPPKVTRRVDPTGTTRRLRALTLEGWSQAAIADATGYGVATIKEQRRGDRKYTSPEFRDAIRELYEAELSPEIEEARQHQSATIASSKGWLPRGAWAGLDIDDPSVHPRPIEV
jgi:transcriptional regulator with XRE-family HTH domain